MSTLVVFGSGPGIGNHIASNFASQGFTHIVLLARNTTRLQEDAAFVSKAIPKVKVDTLRLDLSDLPSIPDVLKGIEKLTEGKINVILFNAARIKPSEPLETPVEEIQEDFTVTNLALYKISQWAIPHLKTMTKSKPSTKPSLLVTNSHLPWDPIPQLLSLSLVKASQANLVESLSRAFSDSGIHIGLIHVEGVVAPEKKNLNPGNIAQKAWEFYESGQGLRVHIKE